MNLTRLTAEIDTCQEVTMRVTGNFVTGLHPAYVFDWGDIWGVSVRIQSSLFK